MNARGWLVKNPEEWMEAAWDFSRPICSVVRKWIHSWEPDLTESIKWSMLCFSGSRLICGLNACKHYAAVAFFRGAELPDPGGLFTQGLGPSIRSIHITSQNEIRRPALKALIHAAVLLDAEPPRPGALRTKRPAPVPPAFLKKALREHAEAGANFKALSPSCQREYIHWLEDAKRPETRTRRLAETIAALAAGRRWPDRKSV